MPPFWFSVVFIASVFNLSAVSGTAELNPQNATIIVMGRSGAGISTTITKILGPGARIMPTSNANPNLNGVSEYEVQLPLPSYNFLKIVDVPGLVDGTTPDQDARTLNALESYCQSSLQNYLPNFFLLISTIDDSRFHDRSSIFTQTLERVSVFKHNQFGAAVENISNNVLLLTRLLGQTPSVQKRPQSKIALFTSALQSFTRIPPDIEILVGENKAADYDLGMRDGFVILPNNQLYPKNILDAFMKIAQGRNDAIGFNVVKGFTAVRSNQESYTVRKTEFEPNSGSDAGDRAGANRDTFLTQIISSNAGITETEINRKLQTAVNILPEKDKIWARSELLGLQAHFQSANIETISQLPETILEKVTFFQNLGLRGAKSYRLLDSAFSLKMPEYVENIGVGHSYDVNNDEVLQLSPLLAEPYEESEIGYVIPNFASCSPIENIERKSYSHFTSQFSGYPPLRLALLQIDSTRQGLNVTNFEGPLRSGFSIAPEQNEQVAQLSVLEEVRAVECELKNNIKFSEEFKEGVNSLEGNPFDEASRDSVSTWNAFFSRFGTHIIKRAYGGGYFSGMVADSRIKPILTNVSRVSRIFEDMLKFEQMPPSISEKPSYSFFGGVKSPELSNITDMSKDRRDQLLSNWTLSLKYNPVLLEYELKLEPISNYARLVNNQVGEEVERVLGILMRQKLVYKQKPKQRAEGGGEKKIVISRPSRVGVATTTSSTTTTTTTERSNQNIFYPTNIPNPTNVPYLTNVPYPTNIPYLTSQTDNYSFTPYPQNSFPATNPPPLLVSKCRITTSTIPTPPPTQMHGDTETLFDHRNTVVGQSYHILKDVILPTSPLDPSPLKATRIGISRTLLCLHRIASFTQSNLCERFYFQRYPNFLEYVIDKITQGGKETNPYHIPSSVPNIYPRGKIQPGNIIAPHGVNEVDYFPKYMETWTGQIKLNPSLPSKMLPQNSLMLRELDTLPELSSKSICWEKKAWVEFFNKWGTHIVSSAHTGWVYEIREHQVQLESYDSLLNRTEYKECVKITTKEKGVETVIRSRWSMGLVSISKLLTVYLQLKERYDWAYQMLLEDKLNC